MEKARPIDTSDHDFNQMGMPDFDEHPNRRPLSKNGSGTLPDPSMQALHQSMRNQQLAGHMKKDSGSFDHAG